MRAHHLSYASDFRRLAAVGESRPGDNPRVELVVLDDEHFELVLALELCVVMTRPAATAESERAARSPAVSAAGRTEEQVARLRRWRRRLWSRKQVDRHLRPVQSARETLAGGSI
eukprot:5044943-Pleurochrysis_carterae.AAC.1